MQKLTTLGVAVAAAAVTLASSALAATVKLTAVQFPEKKTIDVEFVRTAAAPRATLTARVRFKEGQCEVNVEFNDMKPAVLFGGDVTSYVLWAVTREGKAYNLGELWVHSPDDSASYTTPLKEFGMIVTAEPHPLVDDPSDLVIFSSQPAEGKTVRNTAFTFSTLAKAPPHEHDSLADIPYSEANSQDLQQAKKAFEIAEREGARQYAPKLMEEADITLAQATNLATRSSLTKGMRDYSRRTVALASEAIRMTQRKKEAERLEQEIAARRAEMAALKDRAAKAETEATAAESKAASAATSAATAQAKADAATAQAQAAEHQRADLEAEMTQAKAAMAQLSQQRTDLEAQTARLTDETTKLTADRDKLQAEKATLEQNMEALKTEREGLLAERAKLVTEKQALSDRLKSALDQVASTKASARGYIVNLPDILFDVDQDTLKPGARITLAKLSGILLMMPELNARIEGHTDSTGSAAHNMDLSQRRAGSVMSFLVGQGIAADRLASAGYGMERPIADNSTAEGRAKNRRVEIVIAEGTVKEAAAPAK
jgi:outer membrane protein OmpA-like peptidoglycan-associated protein